jgi:hypothetical protein
MDRKMLEDHLTLAKQHVALGEQHIALQHQIIKDLERSGNDITLAAELLATFEKTQLQHIADRDRLQRELQADI